MMTSWTSRQPPAVGGQGTANCQLTAAHSRSESGFTLVELMVVLAVMALLVSIVAPRAIGGVARAEEAVLKQDLAVMRDALDKHYSDAGRYPANLQELVGKRYLRNIPVDPLTKSSATWVVVAPADPEKGAVYDVRSGASGTGSNGQPYVQW
jgi:general secretion pathway protein G